MASGTYTITGTVATPVFDPVPATYTSAQSVTITSVPSDAVIHYTLDGSVPTESSPIYSAPLTISQTTTLKAKAFKSGWEPSGVASGTYTITGTVATPVFDPPPPQTFTSPQIVAVTCATSGAAIHYTLDGSVPTESSPVYSSAIPISQTTTLKAKAFKSGWDPSGVASGTYTIPPPALSATRSFSPGFYTSPGTVDVSIEVSYSGEEPVIVVAMMETIPLGWSFASVVNTPVPLDLAPSPGETGNLQFNWADWAGMPSFPAVLTYRLDVPPGHSGTKTIAGVVYHATAEWEDSVATGGEQVIDSRISIDTVWIDADSGCFVLSWQSVAGKRYQVEASEDLQIWFAASDVIEPTVDGPCSWRDPASAGFDRRFYRLMLFTE